VLGLAHDTQRALRELQGLQWGTLRLGASSTTGIYLLPPVLGVWQDFLVLISDRRDGKMTEEFFTEKREF
jgi:hypothetical protein